MVADNTTYRKIGTCGLGLNRMACRCVQQDFFLETVLVIVLRKADGWRILYFLYKRR